MDIKILHSWLLEHLDTKATPETIAKYMSLCGPSFERVEKYEKDFLYSIEVTTNRVDTANVYGIAREASVILPEFKIKATLKPLKLVSIAPSNKYKLSIKTNSRFTNRVMAVVLDNVSFTETPVWMKVRLEASGMRSLNSIVDITNYVMLEMGHPTHVFDYDLIKDRALVFRLADKGEQITSFDGKDFKLNGGEIVIDDGEGEIIDLPGIIGTKNSVVNKNTQRIVFFIDNNDPLRIRKASMSLGIRTVAATLNEKGVDPELGVVALKKGIELYQKICGAKIASKVYDLYDKKPSTKQITITKGFIEARLGVPIQDSKIVDILIRLGFEVSKTKDLFKINVPSFRTLDVEIPEDIVEEIARIYGYHNLPSTLMNGDLPDKTAYSPFAFEKIVKQKLKEFGGNEIYTPSLVPKDFVKSALKLKNPLGSDSEYLRTSLMPSLVQAANDNSGKKDPFFFFEIANVYLPKTNNLPDEKMTLGAIFSNFEYRSAKGILEALLVSLNINFSFKEEEGASYSAGRRLKVLSKQINLGEFGILEDENLIYLELDIRSLRQESLNVPSFIPQAKYPAQVEDLTIDFPDKTKIGEVIKHITDSSKYITKMELGDIYKDFHTFKVWYQDPNKTLTDKEVAEIRNNILDKVKKKFGGTVKD